MPGNIPCGAVSQYNRLFVRAGEVKDFILLCGLISQPTASSILFLSGGSRRDGGRRGRAGVFGRRVPAPSNPSRALPLPVVFCLTAPTGARRAVSRAGAPRSPGGSTTPRGTTLPSAPGLRLSFPRGGAGCCPAPEPPSRFSPGGGNNDLFSPPRGCRRLSRFRACGAARSPPPPPRAPSQTGGRPHPPSPVAARPRSGAAPPIGGEEGAGARTVRSAILLAGVTALRSLIGRGRRQAAAGSGGVGPPLLALAAVAPGWASKSATGRGGAAGRAGGVSLTSGRSRRANFSRAGLGQPSAPAGRFAAVGQLTAAPRRAPPGSRSRAPTPRRAPPPRPALGQPPARGWGGRSRRAVGRGKAAVGEGGGRVR